MTLPRKSSIQIFLAILFITGAASAALKDKSTYIGPDAIKPANPFLACAVESAVQVGFGGARRVFVYSHSAPVDRSTTPMMKAMVTFLTEDIATKKRNILQLQLTSMDTTLGWQYVSVTGGEIAMFTTLVADRAELRDSDNTLIAQVDISKCP